MEHNGIEYTIHPIDGRREWRWMILPKNDRPREGCVAGTRERAELAAIRAIDHLVRDRDSEKKETPV